MPVLFFFFQTKRADFTFSKSDVRSFENVPFPFVFKILDNAFEQLKSEDTPIIQSD